MKRLIIFWPGFLALLIAPILACGPLASSQVTPTPTKTPRRIIVLDQTPVATPTPLPTDTPVPLLPTDTPTPLPTDTPLPPPTDTPLPPPTDTPPPPPPAPTNTPAPPPPTDTPAPPAPTSPPANPLQISVQFPDGNEVKAGDKIKIVFVVSDPSGVSAFSWGIFTQNKTSLKSGSKDCGGATECRKEIKEEVPNLEGALIAGVDARNVNGQTKVGTGEFYVH